jgi:triacylglycerol lipase
MQPRLRRPNASVVTGGADMPPLVLHHGVCGFGDFQIGPLSLAYFQGIDRALLDRGFSMINTRVHPTAGIATRAMQLKGQILANLERNGMPAQRVLIVAHSMGGLDARYMISKLGMADHVAALLSVTTPHRGSPYADWIVRHLGQRMRGFRLMDFLKIDVQAANDLTTSACRRFNEEVPDAPEVKYFSVSAARPRHLVPAFALHCHKIVSDAEGDNDSLVSVTSSTWGKHLCVWAADHWHTINKRFVVELKNPTGDIAPYYLRAVEQVGAELNRRE